jgi:molybdenum cofactor guanylyltransferase
MNADLPITGFVLAGGQSRRMGRDKALLAWRGSTVGQHVASIVANALGPGGVVLVVGHPARHSGFGYPVIPDLHPGIGPLGGIEAALVASATPWVLVVACDMPAITAEFLCRLAAEITRDRADAILPVPPGGPPNPLCALYHQRALPFIQAAIASGDFKVTRALAATRLRLLPVDDPAPLRGANTPAEWDALAETLQQELSPGH